MVEAGAVIGGLTGATWAGASAGAAAAASDFD
jgi:hypothetical protein